MYIADFIRLFVWFRLKIDSFVVLDERFCGFYVFLSMDPSSVLVSAAAVPLRREGGVASCD